MPLESHQIEPLLYTTPLPLHCEVRAEIAGVWVKAGMMGQAMQEYEALERWERLVDCYMFCGKAAAAENVLRERLQVDGQNPRLLCAMGKLLRQDEWFERAWKASGCKHAGRCATLCTCTIWEDHLSDSQALREADSSLRCMCPGRRSGKEGSCMDMSGSNMSISQRVCMQSTRASKDSIVPDRA